MTKKSEWFGVRQFMMLMTYEKFETYSPKAILDTKNHVAAYYTLPVQSLDTIHLILDKGLKAGGAQPIPMIDEGFMQLRRLEDFDGHTWDIVFLDIKNFKENTVKE